MDQGPPPYRHPSPYRNSDYYPTTTPQPQLQPQRLPQQPGARWEEYAPLGIPPPYAPPRSEDHRNTHANGGVPYEASFDDMLAEKHALYGNGGYYHSSSPPPLPYYPAHSPSSCLQQQRTRPPANSEETMVELGPGLFSRLRGANETWQCIENDFHVPVVCFACGLELCCIQDASYVLCPKCRTVSPLDQQQQDSSASFAVDHVHCPRDGGVGLGFTFDDLFKWQADIMRRRRAALDQRRRREQQQQEQQQQQQQDEMRSDSSRPRPPAYHPQQHHHAHHHHQRHHPDGGYYY